MQPNKKVSKHLRDQNCPNNKIKNKNNLKKQNNSLFLVYKILQPYLSI